MKKIVLFGAGKIAQVANHYFAHDSEHEVVAFSCDREYASAGEFQGRPLVPFDEIETKYRPSEYGMFIALGYHGLNQLRAERYLAAKAKGYRLVSYVSSRAGQIGRLRHGENCLVLENQAIQPFAELGNNVFVWSGSLIGHHSRIGDHCWITSTAAIGGNVVLGERCFLGMNATIGHAVTVGERCLIGAGALITRDAAPGGVYAARDSERHRLSSEDFLRLTRLT
jgi:sugar O-acyltransferase (sialic acid O-acetyltransferase NeuD family)